MEAKRRRVDTDEDADIPGVQDKDVGIVEYVSPDAPGFTGKIKQRYSDFQVNEIGHDDKVVVFTQTGVPDDLKDDEPAPRPEARAPSRADEALEKSAASDALAARIGAARVDECFALLKNGGGDRVRTEPIADKDERTQVHALVRDAFAGRLDSTTQDACVVILKPTKRGRRGARSKKAGPKDDYLHFTLYKENKDTLEAVSFIARVLHVPTKAISFAGTKDRRAATAQRAAWRGGTPSRLDGLNATLKDSIRVGDYSYAGAPIKLGDLKGNQFWIVVRDVAPASLDALRPALEGLRDRGFVNYFGLQRFGTFSVASHVIGRHILCNDFDAAVDGLLGPQTITLNDSREAREVWAAERDAAKALELMPRRCVAESCLLAALKDSPNSLNALMRIPHSLKTMYVHAYQSYIWNRAASRRLQLDRTRVLPGDLVMADADEHIKRARPVTAEEIDAGTFSIFDVVLPTPGFDVLYPQNLVAFYEEIMGADNIDCHDMRRKVKEFSLFGSYRHLLAKPFYVEWFLRRFAGDEDTIVYTDQEQQVHNTKLAPEPEAKQSEAKQSEAKQSAEELKTEEGAEAAAPARTALVLKLGLATSQYATMALREAMKCDTGRHGSMYYSDSASRSAANAARD